MGDMNYRGIDWDTFTNAQKNTKQREENDLFIECIRDNFLFQHITEPTRQRGDDTPSTLDLVLTNEENTITNIEISAPIGASDHSYISFHLNFNMEKQPPKIKAVYDKGNYDQMKQELDNINWDELMNSTPDEVNNQWESFKSIYHRLEKDYITR